MLDLIAANCTRSGSSISCLMPLLCSQLPTDMQGRSMNKEQRLHATLLCFVESSARFNVQARIYQAPSSACVPNRNFPRQQAARVQEGVCTCSRKSLPALREMPAPACELLGCGVIIFCHPPTYIEAMHDGHLLKACSLCTSQHNLHQPPLSHALMQRLGQQMAEQRPSQASTDGEHVALANVACSSWAASAHNRFAYASSCHEDTCAFHSSMGL